MGKVFFTLLQNIIELIKTMCCCKQFLSVDIYILLQNFMQSYLIIKLYYPLSNKWFKGSQFMCYMLLMNIIMDILCYVSYYPNVFAGAKIFIKHKKKLKLACVCMFCGLGKLISIYCFYRVSKKEQI